MGLLTKISGVFGKSTASQRGGWDHASSSASKKRTDQATGLRDRLEDAPKSPAIAEAKPQATAGVGVLEPDDSGDSGVVVTRRAEPVPVPRNKQELYEELQKNYREIVELVRKVDAHLDGDETRGQEFMSIARRIEGAVPVWERLPEQFGRQLEPVVEAIRETAAGDEKRMTRVEQTLTKIGGSVERSAGAQGELITTMAEFRETLGEIGRSSRRSSEVLEAIDERRAQREDEMVGLMKSSRLWMLAALGLSVAMATVAMAIAVVGMVTAP